MYAKKLRTEESSAQVLCLSEGRAQKERSMDRQKEERFLADIEKLQRSIHKGNIVLPVKVGQRVGRIKQRYASMAQYYEIEVVENATGKRVTDVVWTKKTKREERSVLTGCYVIEASTCHAELSSKEIWALYKTLRRVEDSFRALKTDLGMRPVYHQTAKRTEAHLFISVLAYHLLAVTERQLREASDTRRWATIRDELSTHQRMTVVLEDQADNVHHVRVSGKPEVKHRDIYKKLSIADPLKREHRIVSRRL